MHHNALERQLSRGLGGGLAVVWLHGCTWPAAALPAVAWGMWAACGNVGRVRPPQRAWQPRPGENLPQPRRPWLGERLPQQHTWSGVAVRAACRCCMLCTPGLPAEPPPRWATASSASRLRAQR